MATRQEQQNGNPKPEKVYSSKSISASPEERAALGGGLISSDELKALRARNEEIAKAKAIADDEERAKRAGQTSPKTGLSPTGVPESTVGMSENEKFFSEGRALDKEQLGRFKSFGDKSTFDTQNAIRKLKGEKELYAKPEDFVSDVDKSMALGAASALNTPEGRDRARAAGVQSGLSYDDADQKVQAAFNTLKGVSKREEAEAKTKAPTVSNSTIVDTVKPQTPLAQTPLTTSSSAYSITPTEPEAPLAMQAYNAAKPFITATGLSGAKAVSKIGDAVFNVTKGMDAAGATRFAEDATKTLNKAKSQENALRAVFNKGGKVTTQAAEAAMAETSAAAKAAAEAAKIARVSKMLKPFAAIGKATGATSALKVGGKVLGKIAAPVAIASEVLDTGRFIVSPEQREMMTREVEDSANNGMLYSGAMGALSPMKTILGTGKLATEALQSDTAAKKAAADMNTAERRLNAMIQSRRQLISDEDLKKLPQKERSNLMKSIRDKYQVSN